MLSPIRLVRTSAPILAMVVSLPWAGCSHEGQEGAATEEAKAIAAAMAELPAGDRQQAQAQVVCPVSGAALGSMGKPFKVEVAGREVFLCCEGCQPAISKHPEKYLSKLPPQLPQ